MVFVGGVLFRCGCGWFSVVVFCGVGMKATFCVMKEKYCGVIGVSVTSSCNIVARNFINMQRPQEVVGCAQVVY